MACSLNQMKMKCLSLHPCLAGLVFDVKQKKRAVSVPMETASALISDAVMLLHRDCENSEFQG